MVEEGQVLVDIANPDLVTRIELLRHSLAELDVRLRGALADRAAEYRIYLRDREILASELEHRQEQLLRLRLRAPHAGVVLVPHGVEIRAVAPQHEFAEFPRGEHEMLLRNWEGTTVSAGVGLVAVAATEGFAVEAFVGENDVSSISPGDSMVCMLRSYRPESLETHIGAVLPVDVKSIENVGITLADVGNIPVRPSASGQQEPLVTLYRVRSAPQPPGEGYYWGQTGKARIKFGRGPMGSFYMGRLLRSVRLRLQRA
jgi:hypothetical protein